MPTAAKVIDFIDPSKAKDVGRELESTTASLATRLTTTTVTDLPSLEQAVTDRQALGEAIKRVEEFFSPFKQMAHRLHKALCDRETEILAPLRRVDFVKREAITEFKAAQDRLRQARERGSPTSGGATRRCEPWPRPRRSSAPASMPWPRR